MDTLAAMMAKLADLNYVGKNQSTPTPSPPPRQLIFVKEAPVEKKKGTFWNI